MFSCFSIKEVLREGNLKFKIYKKFVQVILRPIVTKDGKILYTKPLLKQFTYSFHFFSLKFRLSL